MNRASRTSKIVPGATSHKAVLECFEVAVPVLGLYLVRGVANVVRGDDDALWRLGNTETRWRRGQTTTDRAPAKAPDELAVALVVRVPCAPKATFPRGGAAAAHGFHAHYAHARRHGAQK